MSTDTQRYTKVAVILHWIMGLSFIAMLVSGILMAQDDLLERSLKFQMYQWHKSLGVLLLISFFLRIGWRLFHKAPSLPGSINKLEQWAAKGGHYALYLWMLVVPLSGWIMVSSSNYGLPTIVFGWFTWPHIPGIAGNEALNGSAHIAHKYLAYVFIALILGHIAAVIKHAVIDKHNLLPRMWFGSLLAAMLILSSTVTAAEYVVDQEGSEIAFTGTHAGNEFTGVFEEWKADITFDPDDLENSHIHVEIKPATAKTGDKMYDGTLPEKDWFDVKNYPVAVFESQTITANENGTYEVTGNLKIKELEKPVTFDFTLSDIAQSPVQAEAAFVIDRLEFAIGAKSDPAAEWVAREIALQLKILAVQK